MTTQQEQRHIYYDADLQIEAYKLSGIVQKFPNHFHDFYVIGFMEAGKRHLWCKGKEYDTTKGNLILFNPGDNHFCSPINNEVMDYRAINIKEEVMRNAITEITGESYAPYFKDNLVYQSDITSAIKDVYDAIVQNDIKLHKEEVFYALIEQVLLEHCEPYKHQNIVIANTEIQHLCEYIKGHYSENITLDDICEKTQFSKYYMIRSFTKEIGLSPYRYLQSIRINEAKVLLEKGVSLLDVAMQCGFSDQSHFTNFFKSFIGITPKQYQKIFRE